MGEFGSVDRVVRLPYAKLCAMLLLLVVTGSPLYAQSVLPGSDLPYRVVSLPGVRDDRELGSNHWAVFADLNGDGVENAVLRHPLGLIALSWADGMTPVLFQHNLPVESDCGARTPSLGQPCDVTGAGYVQIPYIDRTRSDQKWSLCVFDPRTGEEVLRRALPRGEDVRADGVWDGTYSIEATLEGAAPSGGPLLILNRVVRYDRYERGVLAYDARANSMLWSFALGPNPTMHSTLVGDLDGDGRQEIVFGTNSPDNLGGEMINGASDNESFVYALELDGSLRWSYRLGGYYVTPYLKLADLDLDGIPEVIAASACHATEPEGPDRMCRLAVADGSELDRVDLPEACAAYAVQWSGDAAPPSILLNSRQGRLYRIEMQDGRMDDPHQTRPQTNCLLIGQTELTPEPGLELVTILDPGTEEPRLVVHSAEMEPLAEWILPSRTGGMVFTVWRPDEDRAIVMYSIGKLRDAFELVPSPRPPWWSRDGVPQTFGITVGGLALLAWSARRRRRAAAVQPGPARDRLLRLFRELEESSHGTLAATRGVDRLVWLLEAYLNSGQPEGPVLERLRQGIGDFRETVRPRLAGILDQARQAQLPGGAVRATGKGLSDFEAQLGALDLEAPDPTECERALAGLQDASRRTVAGFRALREEIEACFSADPEAIARALLALREPDAPGVRMSVERTPAAAGGDLLCNIDAADLRLVMENLIDNALRAMTTDAADGEAASPSGSLTVRFDREPGGVQAEVIDTGCGVPEAEIERIFESGFSTREGGGLGLARSREIMAFWRGRLELVESEPGKGTTFRLEMKASRTHEPEGI